jgi:choline dehydrogenase-like flavoprotein
MAERPELSSPIGQAEREENAMRADYVIIGAGSAGCVLANRLSTDPGTQVILLEAGGRDWNPLIHIPAAYMKLMDHPTLTWGFKAEPDPGVNGRAILYPRGRVLGGSSSINGMIYVRGQPEDFDHWGQLGNRGWSWDDVLPYFKKAEDWEGGADEFHGEGGPLLTSRTADQPVLCQKLIQAGTEIGLEYHADVNHLPPGAGDSIGWVQQTRRGRRRQSAARTYLRAALKRPNLQVVTNALVHRILLDGTRAVGAEYARGGGLERVDAAREVILAAGAVGSPHVLQLSGIGDPAHLGRVGIPVRHPLPGVGKNLQDHYLARVTCIVTGAKTLNEKSRGLPFAGEVLRYPLCRHRHADLRRLAGRSLGQGAGGIGDSRHSMPPGVGKFCAGANTPARRQAGHDRRHLADAALEPRLCRGALEPAGRPAGDQPALSLRGDRPPCGDRRPQDGAPALRRPGAQKIRRRREPPRQ